MNRTTLFLIFLCASPVPLFAKRGGGGGGFNRGSSGARQQGPGSFQNGGNTFQGSQGGFNTHNGFNNGGFNSGGMRPAGGVNTGGFRNPQQSGGFANRGFSGGSGIGSASRGSTFKNALIGGALGVAGGVLLYEGTKAIINHASNPFPWNNRNYYWGEQYYQGNPNMIQCSMPFDQLQKTQAAAQTPAPTTVTPHVDGDNSTTAAPAPADVDNKFSNIQFQDGSRPKQIVWGCRRGAEMCCGMECCPNTQQPNGAVAQRSSGFSTTAAIIIGYLILRH